MHDRPHNKLTRREALLASAASAASAGVVPGAFLSPARLDRFARATPESVGIPSERIAAFVDAVNAKVGGLHGFQLLRHGKVAAEAWWKPYAPNFPHMLYSLSKSFTSTAVGLAASEGLLSIEGRVTRFFPDKLPGRMDDNLAAMQVKHLLMMGTGHDKDATGPMRAAPDGDWVKQFLSLPVEHAPGSKFVYNSAATYLCSAIVQKVSGKRVLDFLGPRLFQPLGIQRPTWEQCPKGIDTGGWGLSITTEDISRFGQALLQLGQWDGKQLIPKEWIGLATSKQISNGSGDTSDWTQGYGFQFWRCRHGAYRGDGAFGQYCVVFPQQDAVLAITSGVRDMQAVLNCVWEHLLPGFGSAPLPSSEAASRLKNKLADLDVPTPSTVVGASTATGRTYHVEGSAQGITSITPRMDDKGCTLEIQGKGGSRKLISGTRKWVSGAYPFDAQGSVFEEGRSPKAAAKGGWTGDHTYIITACLVETPYIETLTLEFEGDRLTLKRKANVGFGPAEKPTLTGVARAG